MSTIAEEITALNTNLAAAKAAVTTAGGTVGDTGLAGLATEIGTIPSGGGGKIGDFNIISGKITPDVDSVQLLGVMSYDDFLEEVGGVMPAYVFAGIFDAQCLASTLGFAHSFSVMSLKATVHYKNDSTAMTRGGLQSTMNINSDGVHFFAYDSTSTSRPGVFKAGVEYTWFILWKN